MCEQATRKYPAAPYAPSPPPWHSASQQGSPLGPLGAEQVLGGGWRHRGLGLPPSAHPGGAGGWGAGPTVPARCRSGRPPGASLRGGASSSATQWRENKSRDLEAASTRRASLANEPQADSWLCVKSTGSSLRGDEQHKSLFLMSNDM